MSIQDRLTRFASSVAVAGVSLNSQKILGRDDPAHQLCDIREVLQRLTVEQVNAVLEYLSDGVLDSFLAPTKSALEDRIAWWVCHGVWCGNATQRCRSAVEQWKGDCFTAYMERAGA